MLRQLINQEKMRSLSSDDIRELVGNVNILEYSDLANVRNISDVCTKDQPLVLLYETQQNFGHWTCVIDQGDHYECFDSYGILPDSELKWITPTEQKELGQTRRFLSDLLKPYNVVYNNVELQGKKTSTCGRWVSARIILKHWPIAKFVVLFATSDLSPDDLVTLLTLLPLLQ